MNLPKKKEPTTYCLKIENNKSVGNRFELQKGMNLLSKSWCLFESTKGPSLDDRRNIWNTQTRANVTQIRTSPRQYFDNEDCSNFHKVK